MGLGGFMSTEGNRPVKALTSSDQELRLLVETIPALVWRAGPEGNIEYADKRVREVFGKPLGEIGPAMEVALSRKRAKSRTRGRKPHLTGAKARVGRARKSRADLEQ